MAKVTEIQITPIKPNNGLVAFVSCVYDNSFYFSSIALYTRLSGGYRLVYPRLRGIDTFHPISREIGMILENEIGGEYQRLYK